MLGIALLVVGIIGFVKGRINVTKHKELRGPPMYLVCTMLCLPLPLSFVIGMVAGASAAANHRPVDMDSLNMIAGGINLVLIVTAVILMFALAKPKIMPGFPVQMMPGQYPPGFPGQPMPGQYPPGQYPPGQYPPG